ncbi:MAG: hypothetical protein ACI4M4_08860 [Candidatus Ornithospirochaeta sp.]
MKSIRYLAISSLVAFILLFSSCSMEWGKNVYYGGLGGTVKDSDSDSPVSGVSVYVYTEKSARDSAYSSWLDNGGVYTDSTCMYKSTTDSNGKWSVPKIIWTSKDGAWGDDYDHIPVWITYFSEEYGCWTEEDKIEIVSGTSNSNAVISKKSKIVHTSNLNLIFRDGNQNVGDTITFTYSFNDGYRNREEKISTNTGNATINLSYVTESVKVKIYDIKTPNGCWNDVDAITENVKDASQEKIITMVRNAYDLGESGISGTVTANRSFVTDGGDNTVRPIDSLKVVAEVNGKKYTVYTDTCTYDKEALIYSATFSGLAVNEKVPVGTVGTKITVKVFQNKENPSDPPLGSFVLNLEENYRGKNSIIINNLDADKWE